MHMAYIRNRGIARRAPSGSWMPAALQTARYIARGFKRFKSSGKRTKRSMSDRSVTFQHDSNVDYRRRRAPKRVRRRARRSYIRFNKNLVKGLGQHTRMLPEVYASGTITPTALTDSQSVFTVGMYGGISGSATWGDLYDTVNDETVIGNGSALVHFKSAILDVQFRNATDTFTTDPAPVIICLDVYTVFCRKEGFREPGDDWTSGMANQRTAANSTGLATPLTFGTTPFDAPGFGSGWIIGKKTTYRVAPGNSVYMQMKDPKNHVFESDRMEYDASGNKVRMFKGMTKGYVFVVRSADADVANTKFLPFAYEVYYTKTHRYCMQDTAADYQGYD